MENGSSQDLQIQWEQFLEDSNLPMDMKESEYNEYMHRKVTNGIKEPGFYLHGICVSEKEDESLEAKREVDVPVIKVVFDTNGNIERTAIVFFENIRLSNLYDDVIYLVKRENDSQLRNYVPGSGNGFVLYIPTENDKAARKAAISIYYQWAFMDTKVRHDAIGEFICGFEAAGCLFGERYSFEDCGGER